MEKITKIIYKTIKLLLYITTSPFILLCIIFYWIMIDDYVPFYKVFVWFFELLKDLITGNVHDYNNDLEENSND